MIKSKRLAFGVVNVLLGLIWCTVIHWVKGTPIGDLASAYALIGGLGQFTYTMGDSIRKSNGKTWKE